MISMKYNCLAHEKAKLLTHHSVDAVDDFGERKMLKLTPERCMKRIDFEHKIDTYHRLDWINCFKFNF